MTIPLGLTISIEDGKGETGSFVVFLPSTATLAEVETFWAGFDNLISAIVTGGNIRATLNIPLDPLAIAASATSDVQEKAYAAFADAENFLKSIAIPTIDEAVFLAGSKLVDLANVDVAAFVAAMLNGIAGGIQPVTSHDVSLFAIKAMREAWGKYRP